jgi:hypothetical protein
MGNTGQRGATELLKKYLISHDEVGAANYDEFQIEF